MARTVLYGLVLLSFFDTMAFLYGSKELTSHHGFVIEKGQEELTVSGHTFTARFTPKGVGFNPLNGGPQWNWALAGASHEVPFKVSDNKIVYDRPSYREEYLLEGSFIEQQFVVERPQVGDIVIRGRVETKGTFSRVKYGWSWKNTLGEVTLGDVYAYDANGKPILADMEVDTEGTVITIRARDLVHVEYPITIDPKISTTFRVSNQGIPGSTSYQAKNPDVAYDPVNNNYVIVWEGNDAGDVEIFAQRVSPTGVNLGSPVQVSFMTGSPSNANFDAKEPSIVYNTARQEFFVVWAGDDGSDDDFEIYGARLRASDLDIQLGEIKISTTGAVGTFLLVAQSPDVVCTGASDDYLVVWSGSPVTPGKFEIFGQLLNGDGTEDGTDFQISDMGPAADPSYGAFTPRVAFNPAGQYMVVWSGIDNIVPLVAGEFEIFCQLLTTTGTAISPNDRRVTFMGPNGSTLYGAFNPAITFNSSQYFLAWDGDDDTAPLINDESEIFGQYLSSAGVPQGSKVRISDMGVDGNASFDAFSPDVSYDPNLDQLLITWYGDDTTDDAFEVYSQVLNGSGLTDVGTDTRLSHAGTLDGDPSFDAEFPATIYNSGMREHIIVWHMDDDNPPYVNGEAEVYGATYAELSPEPTAQPTAPLFSAISTTSFTVSFTAASGIPQRYIALRKTGSSPTDVPVDGTGYDVGNTIGTSTVAYIGTAITFNESGLTPNTTYFYDFFSLNGLNSSANYLTTLPLEGSVATWATEPSSQASNISFTSLGTSSLTVNFSNGNGSSRLLVAKAGSAINVFPSDGNSYTANNIFGSGSNLGSSNYVVGQGAGPITVTGLSAATVYHFRLFEFNGSGVQSNYNVTTSTGNPSSRTTLTGEPGAQPGSINFTSIADMSMTVGFSPATGPPSGYIGIGKVGSAPGNPTDLPLDGTTYSVGNMIGGSSVAFVGSATLFPLSSLNAATDYHFLILSYNGSGANINYLQTTPLAGNQITLATPPGGQPTTMQFSNPSSTTLDISFAAATGSPTGYIALRKIGTSPTDVPVNATSYSVGNVIGSSVVAYVGASPSFNDSGLAPNIIYHYDVFSYNGVGPTLNYLLVSPLEGSRTTLETEPASQPQSLVLNNFSTTSMEGTFVAAIGNPTGYLVLGKAGSTPLEIPTDGVTYTEGSSLGSSEVLSSGTSITFNPTGLNAGTEYFYKVFAFNGSGASTNYLTPNALLNSAFTLPLAPEVLDANQVAKSSFVARWNASVSATSYKLDVSVDNFVTFIAGYNGKSIVGALDDAVTGLAAATSYKYRVRAENSSGESENSLEKSVTTLAENASSLLISIPTVTLNGANYKIGATLSGGSGTRVVNFFKRGILATTGFESEAIASATDIYETTVEASALDELGLAFYFVASDATTNAPIETPMAFIYKLIDASNTATIPFSTKLDGKSSTYEIFSIPYKLDKDDVPSVFKTEYDKAIWRLFHYQNERTVEYLNGFNSVELGKGYWFNAKTKFDVIPGTGKVAEANQVKDFSITLTAGWNQIGNPYPFNIDWNQIKTANPGAGLNSLWFFENGQYNKRDVLAPWKGAFVFSDNGGAISFPVLSKTTAPGRIKESELSPTLDEAAWQLSLTLQLGERVQVSGIGMHPEAKASKDGFDEITIPRFIDYLEMDTHHPEFFAPHFATDVVPTSNNYNWQFTLSSNLGPGRATLTWDQAAISESQSKIALLDLYDQTLVDMRSTSTYEFVWHEGMQFKVLYSRDGELLPDVTMMGNAYPNPFTMRVTIPFLLQQDESDIDVGVFDVLGRKVKSIHQQNVKAGIHSAEWDGNNEQGFPVEGGLYFYQLRGTKGVLSKTRRMIKQ